MKKTRWIWAALTFVVLTALLLGTALALLVPHNKAANPEAFLLADYFEADTGSDEVVFLGDCEVYEASRPPFCGGNTASRPACAARPSSSCGTATPF
jgi:hypothetical protein